MRSEMLLLRRGHQLSPPWGTLLAWTILSKRYCNWTRIYVRIRILTTKGGKETKKVNSFIYNISAPRNFSGGGESRSTSVGGRGEIRRNFQNFFNKSNEKLTIFRQNVNGKFAIFQKIKISSDFSRKFRQNFRKN